MVTADITIVQCPHWALEGFWLMRQVFISFHSASSETKMMKTSEFSLPEGEKGDYPAAEGNLWSITALQWLEVADDKGGREIKHMVKITNILLWMPCNQKHLRQSQSLSWENCNGISKYVRHKWEAGVFSSVTYTRKSAASNKACFPSLSRLGNLKPFPPLLISPNTLIPSALSSLHLNHLSFLTRRVWPTPTTKDTVSGNNRLAEKKDYSFTGSLICSFSL